MRSSVRMQWVMCVAASFVPVVGAVPVAAQPADPTSMAGSRTEVYRRVGSTELKLHIFSPKDRKPSDRSAAIVFFFGGGWKSGSPGQFVPQCRYFASRGMVAVTADYRLSERDKAKVVDCVADAQAAMRWVRAHADQLGIDPNRIVASGGSAGGHLAAATAMLRDYTEAGADESVSFRPNALVLFNPALDMSALDRKPVRADRGLKGRLGAEPRELSPAAFIRPDLPPTIIFHGKADNLIPYASMESFTKKMKAAGNRCELFGFEGQGHGFFNYRAQQDRYFRETIREATRFLESLGYIQRTDPAATRQASDS